MSRPRTTPSLAITAVALVVALLVSAAPAAAKRPQPGPDVGPRAMWVWDRPSARSLVSFAEGQGVQDLFVSTPFDLAGSPSLGWYRDLEKRAARAGLRLHALGSETTWIDDPAAALAWQRSSLSTGIFDGVHLDVEPWLHPRWVADRDGVVADHLLLLETLVADTGFPVEVDIAFWLDQVPAPGGSLDEAILARVDAVTVMSYRDTATGEDSITAVGQSALDAAARAGRPARLAVETNDLGSGPVAEKQTFHGSTRRAMAEVLAVVDEVEADHPAYAGIAVHDRAGWAGMRR
ncbi:hypothetical protein [Nocardioides donggukensis]|uniref:Amidase n=1 Tax=Nocardioides donggukensis TaxID=2774019 RepID=A0A927K508_9ACTN|nr:hypothetical protein [Nocardioides donggukensis]MBD8870006.1 hypothetical protein [Nocardioides donggukensis]